MAINKTTWQSGTSTRRFTGVCDLQTLRLVLSFRISTAAFPSSLNRTNKSVILQCSANYSNMFQASFLNLCSEILQNRQIPVMALDHRKLADAPVVDYALTETQVLTSWLRGQVKLKSLLPRFCAWISKPQLVHACTRCTGIRLKQSMDCTKRRFANPMWVMENCAAIPVHQDSSWVV